MHPILASRSRVAIFVVAWLPLVVLPVLALLMQGGANWTSSLLFALPLAALHCFIALSSWYSCKATPLRAASLMRVAGTHFIGAIATSSVWSMAAHGQALFLSRFGPAASAASAFERIVRPFFVFGIVLYLLAVGLHYLITTFERAREVEGRALELRVLAREAELRALRAQIDPHFLFNSLNSISALCGSDPGGARAMAILLSDFLRKSLRIGAEESISVAEEVELARTFLEIEKIRFGARLRFDIDVPSSVAGAIVPPLILQPLLENSVRHGVEPKIEGGTVAIRTSSHANRIRIVVENETDADRLTRGTSIGLRNVRRRLQATYGTDATLETTESDGRYRAVLDLPRSIPPLGELS